MTKTRVLTLILLITTVCFSSCRKKPESIGNDLQPSNSLITVSFSDAQDVMASTFTVPYLSTKMLGYAFLGNINDPIFGISNFDFYTQMSLSQSSGASASRLNSANPCGYHEKDNNNPVKTLRASLTYHLPYHITLSFSIPNS